MAYETILAFVRIHVTSNLRNETNQLRDVQDYFIMYAGISKYPGHVKSSFEKSKTVQTVNKIGY